MLGCGYQVGADTFFRRFCRKVYEGQALAMRIIEIYRRELAPTVPALWRDLERAVRQVGAEGIVSKRSGSPYRGGESRDWRKTKVSETGAFVITGLVGREAVAVAEQRDGVLRPARTGEVRASR